MAGAAVGSFITGLFDGIKARHGWEDRKRRQKFEDEDYEFTREKRGWAREDMDWTREDRAHTRSERARTKRLRDEEEALDREAAAEMQRRLEAGNLPPDGNIWATEDPPPAEAPAPAPEGPITRQILRPPGGGKLGFGSNVPAAGMSDISPGRPTHRMIEGTDGIVTTPPRVRPENSVEDAIDSDPTIRKARSIESGDAGFVQPSVRRYWQNEAAKREAELRADPAYDQTPDGPARDTRINEALAQPTLTFGAPKTETGAAAAAEPAPPEAAGAEPTDQRKGRNARRGVAALTAPEEAQPDTAAPPPSAATASTPTPSAAIAATDTPASAPAAVIARGIETGTPSAAPMRRRNDLLDRSVDAYVTNSIPKLVAGYIALGQHDKALAFAQFAEAEKTKKAMRFWVDAMHKGMSGDADGAVKAIAQYNNHFDTGYRVIKSQSGAVRDEAGNITGIRIALRGEDGKVYVENFDSIEDFTQRAAMEASPEKVFEMLNTRMNAAREAAYESGKESLKHERQIEIEREKAGIKAGSPRAQAIEFLAKEHPNFFQLSPTEKEALIEEWLVLQGAQGAREPAMARGI